MVDCPGHASLIRTIIGGMLIIVCLLLLFCFSNMHQKFYIYSIGAQIIDLMLLVVDAIKGIQTQTAEVSAHYGRGCGVMFIVVCAVLNDALPCIVHVYASCTCVHLSVAHLI